MTASKSPRSPGARARARFTDPSRRRGLLIAFEGPDGSGKTTQRKLFKTWLQAEGHDVVTTKWNSSELIKPLVKSRKALRVLSPTEFSLLHAADFRHRVESIILPALWTGKTVIADRFLFTGLARRRARPRSRLGDQPVRAAALAGPRVLFLGVAGHLRPAGHDGAHAEFL
jgi:dTMP kinase